jgi:hypothetical protein
MPVAGRGVSFATLGFLGVASVAFGLWSGLSGPKIADVQLHDAVSNTLAAPGFVATFQLVFQNQSGSSATGSTAYSSSLRLGRIVIEYRAPDRAVMSASAPPAKGSASITQIGSSCWVASTPSSLRVTLVPACVVDSIRNFMSSVRSLTSSTDVDLKNGLYTSSLSGDRLFGNSGGNSSAQARLGSARVEVRLSGDFVDWIHVAFPSGFGRVEESIQFEDVGTAPAIMRPSGAPTSVG